MFLTSAQRIDHSTFSKFLSKFKKEVVALFSQILLVCIEQGLIDFKVLCIDSVKLRANASHRQQKNSRGLEKATVKLRKRIEGLLDNVSSEETDVRAGEGAAPFREASGSLGCSQEYFKRPAGV